MAGTSPRPPEQFYYREPQQTELTDFRVNELAADQAGGLSPYGPDRQFPLPLDRILYTHPSPDDRPRLADGN